MNPWSWPQIQKDSNVLSAEQLRRCCRQWLGRLDNIWYCFNSMRGPLLVETVDNLVFSAAFIIPSTPRKDTQKRENFWFSPTLTSPCPITKVCGAFNNNDFPFNSYKQTWGALKKLQINGSINLMRIAINTWVMPKKTQIYDWMK